MQVRPVSVGLVSLGGLAQTPTFAAPKEDSVVLYLVLKGVIPANYLRVVCFDVRLTRRNQQS